jgi:hypothetical protein
MITQIDHTKADCWDEVKRLGSLYLIWGVQDDDTVGEMYVCDTRDERDQVVAKLSEKFPEVEVTKKTN